MVGSMGWLPYPGHLLPLAAQEPLDDRLGLGVHVRRGTRRAGCASCGAMDGAALAAASATRLPSCRGGPSRPVGCRRRPMPRCLRSRPAVVKAAPRRMDRRGSTMDGRRVSFDVSMDACSAWQGLPGNGHPAPSDRAIQPCRAAGRAGVGSGDDRAHRTTSLPVSALEALDAATAAIAGRGVARGRPPGHRRPAAAARRCQLCRAGHRGLRSTHRPVHHQRPGRGHPAGDRRTTPGARHPGPAHLASSRACASTT